MSISKYNCSHILVKSKKDKLGWHSEDKIIDFQTLGCNISTNVHPYIEVGSTAFFEAAGKGYLLKDCGRDVPGLIKWGSSLAGILDLTYDSAKIWFKDKLANIGFKFFEFRGGDASNLPSCYQFYNESTNPGHFSSEYAKFAADMNGLSINVGYGSQNLPIFVQMSPKDSTWEGLKTLIPTILVYGIMGYPYVLPTPVGGSQLHVDKELYERWMQLNMFLPAIKFHGEMALWTFDMKDTFIDLLKRRNRLTPVILEAFHNVTTIGAPIIRPLWWVAPKDPEALENDSQFMLGDTYLVAPVLERGMTRRNVYLPVGQWKEEFGDKDVVDNRKKGTWKVYNVNIKTIPYFKCLTLYN